MRIAFGIGALFPGGGLQRDCIEVARMVRNAGHSIVIYTARLRGLPFNADFPIILLPNSKNTNHARQHQFAVEFARQTSGAFDLVVGFDKLLGLDVLYCADASFHYRLLKRPYLHLFSRYRVYNNLEGDTFRPGRRTQIILLSQKQRIEYRAAWHTEPERMIELSPTLSPARRRPEYRTNGIRDQLRMHLGLPRNAWIWLTIGVQPRTKGLDRVFRALPHFPQARLLIAGLSESDRAARSTAKIAQRLGISSRVIWLGHRENIEQLLAASDVMMHPARYDTTGTVLLEAVVNGLPVLTTSACGYATNVRTAGAGIVLEEPFDFRLFLEAISEMAEPARRAVFAEAGITYGRNKHLYEGRLEAAKILMDLAERKRCDRDGQLFSAQTGQPNNVVSLPLTSRN